MGVPPPPPALLPVPLKAAFWGLPVALSEMLKAALSRAAADGVNATLIAQLLPADKVDGGLGQLLL